MSFFFFFQAEDGIRDIGRDWSSDVCSSDLPITGSRLFLSSTLPVIDKDWAIAAGESKHSIAVTKPTRSIESCFFFFIINRFKGYFFNKSLRRYPLKPVS